MTCCHMSIILIYSSLKVNLGPNDSLPKSIIQVKSSKGFIGIKKRQYIQSYTDAPNINRNNLIYYFIP